MKKLSAFISFVCILNVLAILGLVGYLLGTGRLDKSKALVITDILKTHEAPEGFRTKVYEMMTPITATQPATSTAPSAAADLAKEDVPATAAERNEYVRKTVEAERLRLENEAQELRNERDMLTQKQAALDARVESAEARKKVFEQEVASANKRKDDASFQKMMGLFDELKPKQIKDLLLNMQAEEATHYLSAMDAEKAAKIINEFKTTDEKKFLSDVLDQIRGAVKGSGTGAASGSDAALSASALPPAKAVP